MQYPMPATQKKNMRFLGLVGYDRAFGRNSLTEDAPLIDLLKGKAEILWGLIWLWGHLRFERYFSLLVGDWCNLEHLGLGLPGHLSQKGS